MADFDTLKEWVRKDWKAGSSWRDDAEENYAFLAGHQWTDAEKADLEDAQRVPIVFNRVAVIVSSVVGSEVNNRTEVRFIPREIGDAEVNEVLTSGAEWFRDESNAEDEDSEAFEDCIICGVGVTETTLDFEADPDGAPRVTRHDPLEIAWDRHAHRKGLQDAQRVHRIREIPTDEARWMFPNFTSEEMHADWLDKSEDSEDHLTTVGDQYEEGDGRVTEPKSGTVRIVQTQWCERERVVEVVLPGTQKPVEISPAKWERFERMGLMIPARRISKKVWRQAFLGRDGILKQNQPDPENCTFTFITGHYDRKEKQFYGLLRSMKDPQKFANKWLSQVLHIINSNAKGGVIAEADAVDDHREFEESWAAADSVNWVKSGTISAGKIKEKPKAQMPQALMALTEYAVSSIRDVSGVNLELLGLRDANQPGVLEYQRRQSAMTTLATFFDALRFYRKRQGQVILHFLRNHIAPTGRLVRLVEEGQARYVPLAVEDDTRRYDVIVDDAPSAPNQRERSWEIISQLLPVFADKLNIDDWALIAEYSPLPASLTERLKEKAQQARDAGPDPMQELMIAQGQAELKKTQSEAMENEAGARKTMAEIAQMGSAPDMDAIKGQQSLAQDAARFQQDMRQDAQRHAFGMATRAQDHQQKMAQQREAASMRQAASSQG